MNVGMDVGEELRQNEQVLLHRSPDPIAFLKHYVIAATVLAASFATYRYLSIAPDGTALSMITAYIPMQWMQIGALGIAILMTLYLVGVEVFRRANDYYVTNQRVLKTYSLISRSIESAPYNRMQDVTMNQNALERIFDVGSIHVNTAGTGGVEIIIRDVGEPLEVKRSIMQQIGKHNRNQGNNQRQRPV